MRRNKKKIKTLSSFPIKKTANRGKGACDFVAMLLHQFLIFCRDYNFLAHNN